MRGPSEAPERAVRFSGQESPWSLPSQQGRPPPPASSTAWQQNAAGSAASAARFQAMTAAAVPVRSARTERMVR